MQPGESEPICLVSFEIARILLGGGPDSRPSFWRAYRKELELNRKTGYRNYHTHLCREQLASLKIDPGRPVFFRHNRLTTERVIGSSAIPRPSLLDH